MSDVLLESRWKDTKDTLLEGLEGARRNSMAVVLENTKNYLTEAATSGASASGNIATLNRVILPVNTHIRVLVTAADVLHSWAVPSFGIKVDACPGRLNQVYFEICRPGCFYGQCSEIC